MTFDRKAREYICWIDLETTGSKDEDEILEIGISITDQEMNEIDSRSYVLPISPEQEAGLVDVVRSMHTVNGLLEKCRAEYQVSVIQLGNENAREGLLRSIDAEISNWVKTYVGSAHIPFAGSGILHYDRKYIKRDLPKLDKRLTYFGLDIGVVRRFLELAGIQLSTNGNEGGEKNHRALDDARLHSREAKRFLEWAKWRNA